MSKSHLTSPSSLGVDRSGSASCNEFARSASHSPLPADWSSRDENHAVVDAASQSLEYQDVGTSYQLSLSAMVKSNTDALIYMKEPHLKFYDDGARGLEDYHYNDDYDELQQCLRSERRTAGLSSERVTVPFNFPSVDPLHYLPIAPNPQNSKLFHACE